MNHRPPLVVHIIYRLGIGGLENGLVNLINHMPAEHYQHAIVSLTDFTDFRARIERDDVKIIALCKKPGNDLTIHARLWKLLRSLRPDIVHTRNLAAIECQATAALAGGRARIHSEHGLDLSELEGRNRKYNLFRLIMRPFIHRYIAVSADLADWMVKIVGIPAGIVVRICNGVDAHKFSPRIGVRPLLGPEGFACQDSLIVGTVGRMQPIKDHLSLIRAFLHLIKASPELRTRLRLVLVGDGPQHEPCRQLISEADAGELVWMPGERSDIPNLLRFMDLFVLTSLREGISNTILEAMASRLPVIATRVGGNPELVEDGRTGTLIPPSSPSALAAAIENYVLTDGLIKMHGHAGRMRVESEFSIEAMIAGYLRVYNSLLYRLPSQHPAMPSPRSV